MIASIQLQRRSVGSQYIPADVFEQTSLSILRRYRRAATPPAVSSRKLSRPARAAQVSQPSAPHPLTQGVAMHLVHATLRTLVPADG